jgi:hypothetical protein
MDAKYVHPSDSGNGMSIGVALCPPHQHQLNYPNLYRGSSRFAFTIADGVGEEIAR